MRETAFGQHGRSSLDRLIETVRFRKIIPKIKPGAVVVDLGCGYQGALLEALGPRIKLGIGIDLDVSEPVAARIVLKKGRIDQKLPLADGSSDVVTALAVIEHVADPDTLLKEAYRILKPKGFLLLTTPSAMSKPVLEFLAFRLKIIDAAEISDHKRYYTSATLRETLVKNGFEPSKIVVSSFELGLNLFAQAVK